MDPWRRAAGNELARGGKGLSAAGMAAAMARHTGGSATVHVYECVFMCVCKIFL
jgi:hypothetical protein